jgi:hypothetical protein
MRSSPARAAVAALLLAAVVPAPAPARAQDASQQSSPQPFGDASTPTTGRWVLASVAGETFSLELFWNDGTNWPVRTIAFSDLHGAAPRDIAAPTPTPVAFRVERDAGDFEFEGQFFRGRGSGSFRYRPERRFVDTLRALGVAELGAVSDHDLKNLAYGDISAASVREFRTLGLPPLRKSDLLELAVRHVTPEYVGALQSLGVPGANTVPGVVELRFHDVPVEYVRELDALGFRRLPGPLLVAMRRNAVTPAFIRRVREGGQRDVSPEALIELRQRERARTSRR